MADIRDATPADLGSLAAMADRRRDLYACHQPQLWREAPDASAVHRRLLVELIAEPRVVTLVASRPVGELDGFVTARTVRSSPLHDPGGPTGFIDDLAVASPDLWPSVGVALLGRSSSAPRHLVSPSWSSSAGTATSSNGPRWLKRDWGSRRSGGPHRSADRSIRPRQDTADPLCAYRG